MTDHSIVMQELNAILAEVQCADSLSLATRLLSAFCEKHPKCGEGFGAWAWAAWHLGDYELAIRNYDLCIDYLDNTEARYYLARVYLEIGQPERAIEPLNEILERDPNNVEAMRALAVAFLQKGSFRKAERYQARLASASSPEESPFAKADRELLNRVLETYASLKPLVFKWLRKRTIKSLRDMWASQRHKPQAEDAARCLCCLEKNRNPMSLLWLGNYLRDNREYFNPRCEEEIGCYIIADQLGEREARKRLIVLFAEMGRYESGWSYYQSLPNGESDFRSEMAGGDCASALQRWPEAKSCFQKASQFDAKNFYPRINLGLLALKNDDRAGAIRRFKEAFEVSPQHPLTQFYHAFYCGSAIPDDAHVCLDDLALRNNWLDSRCGPPIPKAAEPPDHFKNLPCPLCGSQEDRGIFFDPFCNWRKAQCQRCGFIYVNPAPDSEFVASLYTQERRQEDSTINLYAKELIWMKQLSVESRNAVIEGRWSRFLPDFDFLDFESSGLQPKKILDVGCSVGRVLFEFQSRGWSAVGIDCDPFAVDFAKGQGLDAHFFTVESADFPSGSFDMVTMEHVIEHFMDPLLPLRRIFDWLRPGGVLRLETPCAESLPYWICLPEWLTSGEHLCFFSRQSLVKALEMVGFSIRAVRSSVGGWTPSRLYKRDLGYLATSILKDSMQALNLGDNIYVIAQKPGRMGQ